jgi:hypothetical protein
VARLECGRAYLGEKVNKQPKIGALGTEHEAPEDRAQNQLFPVTTPVLRPHHPARALEPSRDYVCPFPEFLDAIAVAWFAERA